MNTINLNTCAVDRGAAVAARRTECACKQLCILYAVCLCSRSSWCLGFDRACFVPYMFNVDDAHCIVRNITNTNTNSRTGRSSIQTHTEMRWKPISTDDDDDDDSRSTRVGHTYTPAPAVRMYKHNAYSIHIQIRSIMLCMRSRSHKRCHCPSSSSLSTIPYGVTGYLNYYCVYGLCCV